MLHRFKRKERIILFAAFCLGAFFMLFVFLRGGDEERQKHWDVQSIDTMKESRDKAREYLNDPKASEKIERQVAAIAQTGATHIAIATPYDDEFLPVLKLWAHKARQYELKIWFRGNWSGWEQWFGYEHITDQDHIKMADQFIRDNETLFEDGDIFSSCPECENGANIEFSNSIAVIEYRKFLLLEYKTTKTAFSSINKEVASNYYSMNADVAKRVMDRETTQGLDNLVVIDHYVKTPEQLAQDVIDIATLTGGKIVLGEIGVPIPDIHSQMTDEEQKKWLYDAMILLSSIEELEGVNYWVNMGGSTALWHADGSPKPALEVLTRYYGG